MTAKRSVRWIAFICCVAALLACTGVYATWSYFYAPDTARLYARPSLGAFTYGGTVVDYNDVLPTDTENGKSHLELMERILSNVVGLNNSNSALVNQIEWANNIVYRNKVWGTMSKDIWISQGGDTVKNQMGLADTEISNLSFMIQTVSSSQYYVYTTSISLGEAGEGSIWGNSKKGSPNIPIGQYIYEVYRTNVVLEKGVWVEKETTIGSAPSAWYDENLYQTKRQIPSFDVYNFVPYGQRMMGSTFAMPIYTYPGYGLIFYPDKSDDLWHFIVQSKNVTQTVTATGDEDIVLKIYDSNQNLISTIESIDHTCTYTFRASTMYYFTVEGAPKISISVN